MPIAGIVLVSSLGTIGTRYTTVAPVYTLSSIVPVSGIMLILLVGTHRHHRETTTVPDGVGAYIRILGTA